MNDYRINVSYAKALLLLATELGDPHTVATDMRLVEQVAAENRQLSVLMANPTIPQAKKASIVSALFDGKVSQPTLQFLLFLVRKKRSVQLLGISRSYLEQYRESQGIVLSHLVTHQPVTDAAKQEVKHLVEEYTGKRVELDSQTDPNMLGSFKLEFDGKMYDARLRTKIRRLLIAFSNNEYESKL